MALQEKALIEQQGSKLIIHSAMTVDTANALLEQSLPLLAASVGPLELDMGEVSEADSSAISLMLEWLRVAKNRKLTLQYSNLPKSLLSLAGLYGVLEMIPQVANTGGAKTH